ncbi:MAG: Unknown protein [uncultured Sulfurovum sp.]|uniref:Uncharacterized protein n=1 Tax=uncultured Sulfurovum sp. TaxID=269237 RepID=A0A6S6T1N8_9BACT|nr:MAG: Unknown protein [uncultured Sulfurovum sp.]
MKILLFLFPLLLNALNLDLLSKEPTWLTLLHYKDNKSSIVTKEFFLNPKGDRNAKEELNATLEAYYLPFIDETHARCKYPARYLWLSTKINLPDYKAIDNKCVTLKEWKILEDVKSISAVFVSGYLGNPASAFGHSFITVDKNSGNKLLNHNISFGADLPDKYDIFSYIYNGVIGGYKGLYTDKYYYLDDLVYSQRSLREMWQYEMNLTKYEQKLILFHFWELLGQKFAYYFFNRNCGYRVSELLELVHKEPILGKERIWYAPAETFHKLNEFNQKSKVFNNVNYLPSKQQLIYDKYHYLDFEDKEKVLQIFSNDFQGLENAKNLNMSIETLDMLLEYIEYLNTKKNFKQNKNLQNLYRRLLQKRIVLPASLVSDKKVSLKQSVTQSSKTSFMGLGGNTNRGLEFKYAPFVMDSVDYNTLDGDILSVLDGTLFVKEGKFTLKALNILKIRRLNINNLPVDTQDSYSWGMHIGSTKHKQRDYFLDVSIGKSWKLKDNMKLYALLHGSWHSHNHKYRLAPSVGLFMNLDTLKVDMIYKKENIYEAKDFKDQFSLQAQKYLHNDSALYLEVKREEDINSLHFGYKWYF